MHDLTWDNQISRIYGWIILMHAHLNYTVSKMFNIQEKLDMSLHRTPTMNSKTQIARFTMGADSQTEQNGMKQSLVSLMLRTHDWGYRSAIC